MIPSQKKKGGLGGQNEKEENMSYAGKWKQSIKHQRGLPGN